MSTAPCNESLVKFGYLDHDFLRTLTDGRCPICDPSMSREEYGAIVKRIAVSYELQQKAKRK